MKDDCKKCLLHEAGDNVTYEELMRYVATLPQTDLVTENHYQERITHCISCDHLIAGMCLKCGCYVEVRCRLKEASCPDADHRRWQNV